jgi:enoyl-CoA hydratase/carnithine racemase
LFLLGEPFTATRAAELGLATRVVPDLNLLATATEAAQKLAAKPSGALRAGKRLIKQASIGQLREAALKIEPPEFFERLRSAEAKEAFSAFLEKRQPDFNRTKETAKAEKVS